MSEAVVSEAGSRVGGVDVPLAAFGTLSNGSDVRLLAVPESVRLSSEAAATIEEFFYAAWKSVSQRRERYFAFLQLDHLDRPEATTDANWALLQVCPLGTGVAGEVLVVWAAILPVSVLDRIGWATHRILGSAFPDPYLPTPGTKMPLRRAELMTGSFPAVDSFETAFLWLIRDTDLHRGGRAAIAVEKPSKEGVVPLRSEGVLFGLWDRLGKRRADRSYCTWAGIEKSGFPARGDQFSIVLDEATLESLPVRTGRKKIAFGADTYSGHTGRPDDVWLTTYSLATGVSIPLSAATNVTPEAATRLAESLLELFGRRAVEDFGTFATRDFFRASARQKAPDNEAYLAKAMPIVLRLSARRLASTSRQMAASAIDSYVSQVVPRLKLNVDLPDPMPDVLQLSLETNTLPLLSEVSLRVLAPTIFDETDGTDQMLNEVTGVLTQVDDAEVDWKAWAALAFEQLKRPMGADLVRFFWAVVAGGFSSPSPPLQCDPIFEALMRSLRFAAVVTLLENASRKAFDGLFLRVAAHRPTQVSPYAPTAREVLLDHLRLYHCAMRVVPHSLARRRKVMVQTGAPHMAERRR